MVENTPANAGDARDTGSIPGLGRSPEGGHGNPLQYSCLENPLHRGAWWVTVHRVAKIRTRLKQLGRHTQEKTTRSGRVNLTTLQGNSVPGRQNQAQGP